MQSFFDKHRFLFLVGGFGLAMLLGLGLGYLLFRAETSAHEETHLNHTHDLSRESATWTCSMHPQIRQDEPGDCPICGMDLILLDESSSTDPLVLEMTPEAVKLAQIETSRLAAKGTAGQVMVLSGKIQADERLAATQVAHVPGRIEQLYVSFKGEYVQKGQRIARLYSPDLITAQQELIQALSLKDRNPELYAAARKKLLSWKLTEAQILELEESKNIQQTLDLYADASGVVSVRRVSVGDYLQRGEALFDLVNLSRVWVLLDAYEKDLAQIAVGDQVQFVTPSVPGKTFTTRITFIDPLIDSQTRVAAVRGEIANPDRSLKPEMFVRGTLLSSHNQEGQLLVPKSAVLWTGQRSVVYLKLSGEVLPSFRYQEVELGERVGDAYVALRGLQSGDEVVTQGSFTLDAAAQLNNQASMMNRWVTPPPASTPESQDLVNETPQGFQEQLSKLIQAYLPIKDALVTSDSSAAGRDLQRWLDQLAQTDFDQLPSHLQDAASRLESLLSSHGQDLNQAKNLTAQRKEFKGLSSALIEAAETFGIGEGEFFIQHCPMADDFNGADWISGETEVLNPYFGDEMLHCGNVEDTLTGK